MHFLIITHVVHRQQSGALYGYAPYVREMNLWLRHVEKVTVFAPLMDDTPTAIDLAYQHSNLQICAVPALHFQRFFTTIKSLCHLPGICWRMYRAIHAADHVHLRCPGNMGLLGCLIQICFPKKIKTAKYAGNWDPQSAQPRTYRWQRWLLTQTWLTKNIQVLIYGDWSQKSRNLKPFFTASYHGSEIASSPPRLLVASDIRLIFVGALTANKRPDIALEVVAALRARGIQASVELYGAGDLHAKLKAQIEALSLQHLVSLCGNVPANTLKNAYQAAHFLVFASHSEGWPKAVAEAMFWGCLPLTTAVSCVPHMVDNGRRGHLVPPDANAIAAIIEQYVNAPELYRVACQSAMDWSRQFTLERFEAAIQPLLAHAQGAALD
jgi:glycosyltransferase involved in cell wall biosynthesis